MLKTSTKALWRFEGNKINIRDEVSSYSSISDLPPSARKENKLIKVSPATNVSSYVGINYTKVSRTCLKTESLKLVLNDFLNSDVYWV